MTREEFDSLLKECELRTYAELANLLNVSSQNIVIWNRNANYPKYLKQALQWYKLAKRYDKINSSDDYDTEIKKLKEENIVLEKKLEYLESLKKIIKDRLS